MYVYVYICVDFSAFLGSPGADGWVGGDLVATKRACTQAATERNEALRMERATKPRIIPIQVLSLGCFETNDKTAYLCGVRRRCFDRLAVAITGSLRGPG
jgi:hypothetical protein